MGGGTLVLAIFDRTHGRFLVRMTSFTHTDGYGLID